MGPGGPLSGCGTLREAGCLFLCEKSLGLAEDDSDYQLACCFKKFTTRKPEYEDLLLRFFERKDSYTRRCSLGSLAHLGFPGLVDLVVKLWTSDDCEFAKLDCLYTLQETPGAGELFENYLAEFEANYDVANSEHLPGHIEWLRSGGLPHNP